MSYTYLQEQGAESSAASFAGIPQSVLLKLSPIADRSCCSGNGKESCQCSQSGTMSPPSMENHGVEGLIWLPVDSLARTYPRLEKARELMVKGPDCGEKWQGLSVRLNPDMSGWKTARCLFIEDLPESSVILPGWGLMQGGEFWGLMMPGHPTEEKESGSLDGWPTPTVNGNYNRKGASKTSGDGLATVVSKWPTPTAPSKNGVGRMDEWGGSNARKSIRGYKESKSKLNPDWVEWLMGWPIGWTSLEPLQGATIPTWSHDPGETGEVPRAAHKIKSRVARLKAIGNGQVPQVVNLAWWILSAGMVESCN